MDRDELFFGQAAARIMRWIGIFTAGGSLAGLAWRGWRWAAGFLLGALASWVNFRWMQKLVWELGDAAAGRRKPRKRLAVILGLRYLLLGGAAYAIVITSTLSLTAALVGVFVSVAAVVVEILYELIYART